MRGSIRGVIFDIDDTLYTEKYYVYRGFEAAADFLGDRAYYDRLWDSFLRGRFGIADMCEELGVPEKTEEAIAVYQSVYCDIQMLPGARELMEELKARGLKLGIVSDGVPEAQDCKVEALGIRDLMDDILYTETLGGHDFRKPNPEAFRVIQRRWGIPFSELVYIGDNPKKDFSPCLELGMQAVFFKNPEGMYSGRPYDFPFPIAEDWMEAAKLLSPLACAAL